MSAEMVALEFGFAARGRDGGWPRKRLVRWTGNFVNVSSARSGAGKGVGAECPRAPGEGRGNDARPPHGGPKGVRLAVWPQPRNG
jgi:hypothetical protein